MKNHNPHINLNLKQSLLRTLTNATFFLFISGALFLTIFIVVSQPPTDPWLGNSPTISQQLAHLFSTKLLNASTFHTSGSLLLTGEDLPSSTSIPHHNAPPAGDHQIEDQPRLASCTGLTSTISCADPGVLEAIRRVNAAKFPGIEELKYETPVEGGHGSGNESAASSCDVGWSYRPRRENSRRIYRDFRRYWLSLAQPGCRIEVSDVGGWHSGKNARLKWKSPNGVNASAPSISSHKESDKLEKVFGAQKYLYYTRGGDQCKSMSQFLWSFLCALGEARYLNRTLVIETQEFCISNQPHKNLQLYIDFNHLRNSTPPVIEHQQFISHLNRWKKQSSRTIKRKIIEDEDNLKTAPMNLLSAEYSTSTLIERSFKRSKEPDNFWYRVCEGEAEKVIHRPWELIWKPKPIMGIVNAICSKLEWDFDAIQVVRGEKAEDTSLWPNLERDTRPESIIARVSGRLNRTRFVYISSNERSSGFFDGFKREFPGASVLADYKHLWEPGSEWFNETRKLVEAPEFDEYMRDAVDSEMFLRARTRIETFGDLTGDCRDGINTC